MASNRLLPRTRRALVPSSCQGDGPCCESRTRLASLEGWSLTDRPSTVVAVQVVLSAGIEPAACASRGRRSATELRQHEVLAAGVEPAWTITVSAAYKAEPVREVDSAACCRLSTRRGHMWRQAGCVVDDGAPGVVLTDGVEPPSTAYETVALAVELRQRVLEGLLASHGDLRSADRGPRGPSRNLKWRRGMGSNHHPSASEAVARPSSCRDLASGDGLEPSASAFEARRSST